MNCILRPWQQADPIEAAKLATPNVSKYMSEAFPGSNITQWEQFSKFAGENPSAFYRVIEVEGKFAGNVGVLIHNDNMCKNAELAYWIGDAYRGKGIATWAVTEMVKLVFRNTEITRIYATPFGVNYASQRVLEKAGFTLEATLREIYCKNGALYDGLVYAKRR